MKLGVFNPKTLDRRSWRKKENEPTLPKMGQRKEGVEKITIIKKTCLKSNLVSEIFCEDKHTYGTTLKISAICYRIAKLILHVINAIC
ncbi:unnamed protein product [Leptidea sinapis]|uniref:Uncharacterized protein n=1 Tax=Leptidea sinapis TaxID=189913 RepID=A0A5E4QDK0_9NEOP|nr:unnamed protein product [Leptidea sinapis]